ncbi:hypothetical protein PoB_001034000 [Plakobranchus ocellatus]|uniref:TIR domain-containing protein n=1 Tax=Plakobranchus ocellatus TaxID=259542 RepID=A0AAV3YM93_9GAST|nr:hypothetical protein PoB_001034000 [Plakobranchus ocellatus]
MAPSYDVVIGYHASDIKFVEKLSAKLEKSGLTVWYKKNQDEGKQTSEAILGCKIYLPVMTELSAVDKNIQEQLSLAYISNSAIYPLAQIRFRYLSPKLNGGAKLMLAKINWCFVFNMDEFDSKLDAVINCMKRDLSNMSPSSGGENLTEAAFSHGLVLTHGPNIDEMEGSSSGIGLTETNAQFWDRHFQDKQEVPWTEFRDKFRQDYGKKIDEELPDVKEDKLKFIINLIYKDIFDMEKTITRKVYDDFCVSKDPHAFFSRTQEYVVAYLSLREVLAMDSSLRIPVIQSLGQFSFPAIVAGLSDMLKDDDPNVRAVAAIALAHAGRDKQDTVDDLIGIIEDEDRLVRESACLSLGFLRSARAVSYVVDRWRNDPISTVREAAELALSKMDAVEAQRCMKVTQVLSSEMSALKPKVA